VDSEPIPENVNRLVVEGEVARTVDEAISVLRSLFKNVSSASRIFILML